MAGRAIPFLGRESLIANKRATGSLEDLADVEALGEGAFGRRAEAGLRWWGTRFGLAWEQFAAASMRDV